MNVGGGLPGCEMGRGVGWLFKDLEASTHSTPDDGVVVKLDGDVPCLRDLPLMSHADGDEVGGYVDPKALGTFIRGVSVQGRLSRGSGTSYSPLHLLARFNDCWWASPSPILSPSSSSSSLCRWGDLLPFFSVDCQIAVGKSDKMLSLLC